MGKEITWLVCTVKCKAYV